MPTPQTEQRRPLAIDLFAGLGGWSESLLAEGWQVVGFDIERHVYGAHRYPAQLVVQDVLTLCGAQFRDADLIVASPPCFVADTLILTARGMVPIPSVVKGDLVLTHQNRWRRVLRVGQTRADTMLAKGYGGSLEGTKEHPLYVRRNTGGVQPWKSGDVWPVYRRKVLTVPEWRPLAECEGLHWASPVEFAPLPLPKLPCGLPDTPAFWWMVGRWVGDGWVRVREKFRSGNEVIICCGAREADELGVVLSLIAPRTGKRARIGELHWRRANERTVTKFHCASNELVEWLIAHFGRYADGKSWPAWALGMAGENRRALLDGYVSADGCEGFNGEAAIIRTSTISRALAIGTRLIAASLGSASNLGRCERPETYVIEGREVHQKDTWQTSWTPGVCGNRLVDRDYGMQWGKIRKISAGQTLVAVWNIEVEEDNSYVANGIVVHNCQFFSYCAMPWTRAKALAAAVRADPERLERELALFKACFRIQREACEAAGRHVPLVVENVRGAIPWVGRSRWNWGSFHLWGDVPALMPMIFKHKVPGFRLDGSGGSFQSASVAETSIKGVGPSWDAAAGSSRQGMKRWTNPSEGFKRPGIDLSDVGFNVSAAREFEHSVEGAAYRRTDDDKRQHIGVTRKFASAMIAKIPEPLARHIARVYRP